MRFHFPFQIVALVPFMFAGLLNGFAFAQSPVHHSFGDIGSLGISSDNGNVSDNFCPGNDACPPTCSCWTTRTLSTVGKRRFWKIPSGSMPQRYPYRSFQMSYYARPYSASDRVSVDASSYSNDAFEAARLEVQSYLAEGANLEYADAPRGFWPHK